MLDPTLLRGQLADTAARLLATRGYALDVSALEALESERKQLQGRTQELQNLRNTRSKAIGMAKGKGEDTTALMAEVAGLADELKASELRLEEIRAEIDRVAMAVPNIPHDSVPAGKDETDNQEVRRFGVPRTFDFPVKDHVELGARDGWLDGDTAAKLSGARFTVLRGQLARLHRALAQFMLDLHTQQHQYLEVNVPLIVNADSLRGTGQLPKFEDDLFATEFGDPTSANNRRYLSPPAKCRSPTSCATPSSKRTSCRCAWPRTACASAPRLAATAATRAASSASTSSKRWNWSASRSPKTARKSTSA